MGLTAITTPIISGFLGGTRGNFTIEGDLVVNGSSHFNKELIVDDNIIDMLMGAQPVAGITINRLPIVGANAEIMWVEALSTFQIGLAGNLQSICTRTDLLEQYAIPFGTAFNAYEHDPLKLNFNPSTNRLGINVQTPSEALHLKGNAQIEDGMLNIGWVSSAGNATINLKTTTTTQGSDITVNSDKDLFIINRENADSIFINDGDETLRLQKDGNVQVKKNLNITGTTITLGDNQTASIFGASHELHLQTDGNTRVKISDTETLVANQPLTVNGYTNAGELKLKTQNSVVDGFKVVAQTGGNGLIGNSEAGSIIFETGVAGLIATMDGTTGNTRLKYGLELGDVTTVNIKKVSNDMTFTDLVVTGGVTLSTLNSKIGPNAYTAKSDLVVGTGAGTYAILGNALGDGLTLQTIASGTTGLGWVRQFSRSGNTIYNSELANLYALGRDTQRDGAFFTLENQPNCILSLGASGKILLNNRDMSSFSTIENNITTGSTSSNLEFIVNDSGQKQSLKLTGSEITNFIGGTATTVLNSTGLGIGKSPTRSLEIKNNASYETYIRIDTTPIVPGHGAGNGGVIFSHENADAFYLVNTGKLDANHSLRMFPVATTDKGISMSNLGKVGFNVIAPTQEIDVLGNTLVSGKMMVTAATNYIDVSSNVMRFTDGVNGTVSLSTLVAGGSNPWVAATGGINYTAGNVGINQTTPTQKLHIIGSSKVEGNLILKDPSYTPESSIRPYANGVVNCGIEFFTSLGGTATKALTLNGSFVYMYGALDVKADVYITKAGGGSYAIYDGATLKGKLKVNASYNMLEIESNHADNAISMGSKRIIDVKDPVNAQEAATKNYVDSVSSAGLWTVNTTANRPGTPTGGQVYFDSTLGIPIWYNGTNWVNAAGATV